MPKFLILDDDAACRHLLKQVLSPYGQCDVTYDGHEAIAAVRIALDNDRPYDLICLDVMMPSDEGHQLVDAIRRLEGERGIYRHQGAKILMTTSLKDSAHCIGASWESCESYLTKPLHEQAVLAQVESLLGELHATRPRSAVDPKSPLTASAPRPAAPAPRRFLIVDDDRVCRELLQDLLSRYGECDLAYDGAEAIDAVRLAIQDGTPYDLVCLDIMMPNVSGHDALLAIRQTEAEHGVFGLDGVKIIMTTALRDSKHCVQAFREGCESYVTKPIHEAELLARIREIGLVLEPRLTTAR